jgi:alanine-synthesizing transaminase
VRRDLLEFAARHALPIIADEVYGDVAHAGVVPPLGSLDPDAPIISFSSLSKAYLAPGWRAGWMGIGRSPRLDDVVKAVARMADARLCSTLPMQYAIEPALTGDRSHQAAFRAALDERARITADGLNAIPGVSCVRPAAAFYAMPRVSLPPGKTDEDYVIGLLRATGVLTVYGSGFGMLPADGYLRVVFLASPDELREVYRLMGAFTREFLNS